MVSERVFVGRARRVYVARGWDDVQLRFPSQVMRNLTRRWQAVPVIHRVVNVVSLTRRRRYPRPGHEVHFTAYLRLGFVQIPVTRRIPVAALIPIDIINIFMLMVLVLAIDKIDSWCWILTRRSGSTITMPSRLLS